MLRRDAVEVKNSFAALQVDADDQEGIDAENGPVGVNAVEINSIKRGQKMTRVSGMEFNVADVRKPLASAVKVMNAGNRIVLDQGGSYIENRQSGEKMEVRVQKDTFVFDVQFEDGEQGAITLDSGAGCNVCRC